MITILGGVSVTKNGEPSQGIKDAISEHGIYVPYNPENVEMSNRPDYWNEAGQVRQVVIP